MKCCHTLQQKVFNKVAQFLFVLAFLLLVVVNDLVVLIIILFLLSAGKGFWSEMLGVGDFYYEIGVQIIEVCLATQHRNGGLMNLEELLHKVRKTRGQTKQAQDVSL